MQIELKKYLQDVLKLENDDYAAVTLYHEIQSAIKETENKGMSLSPKYPWKPQLRTPEKVSEPKWTVKAIAILQLFAAFFLLLIVLIMVVVCSNEPVTVGEGELGAGYLLMYFMVCYLGLFIYFGPWMLSANHSETAYKEYLENVEKCKQKHEAEMEQYNKDVAQIESDYQSQIKLCDDYIHELKQRLPAVIEQHNTIRAALDKIYSADIVFKKYRSLVPIAMFCEYIESGRCTELEGHEGAYNIYESELRQNVIIDKLETISEKLENIRNNQFVLYEAISEANHRAQAVFQEVSKNSQLAAQAAETNAVYQREQTRLLAMNNQIAEDIRNIEFYNTFIK